MANSSTNHNTVQAQYTTQRIPRFKGNPLIEALPPVMDDDALIESLSKSPEFDEEQRSWTTHDRIQMLMELSKFRVPLLNHIELARTLDALLRESYVGRAPKTAEHTRIYQRIYDNQQAGKTFSGSYSAEKSQYTTSLIGPSGMGKTSTLRGIFSKYPPVIYHPEHHLWQITYLHIETPYDGSSVKGLAHSILRKLDELIPDANYYQTYALKGKPGTETLMNHVARLLHAHCVGVLICDEIQNLSNAGKNDQSLMTLLVSASNELQIPILFVGTNKAHKLLKLDFRQARRSTGFGLSVWNRLQQGTMAEPQEWEDFMTELWRYQWTRNPVAFNEHFSQQMYHYSQGIIDVAIKLFVASQLRAMMDGTELITSQIIDVVWKSSFKLLHPMIEALQRNDWRALEMYDDIKPISFDGLFVDARLQYQGKRLPAASIKPDDEVFIPRLTKALETVGLDNEQALLLSETVASEGKVNNVLEGLGSAMEKITPPRPIKERKAKENQVPEYEARDLRNAIQIARQNNTSIMQQLENLGLAPKLEPTILTLQ